MLNTSVTGSAAVVMGLILGGAVYAQTGTPPSGTMNMSQAECLSLWNRLDAGRSGNVSEAQAAAYIKDFKSADANGDGRLSQAEFQAACDKGQVQGSATTGSGSGSTTAPKN